MRILISVTLIIIGLGLLAGSFGLFAMSAVIWDFWPIVFVLIGINIFRDTLSSKINGTFFIVFGLLLIAANIDIIPGGFWNIFWPLLIIFFGIRLFSNSYKHNTIRSMSSSEVTGDSNIKITDIFSGSNHLIDNMYGNQGSIESIFSGTKIDFRHTQSGPDHYELKVTSVFAGVEIFLPNNWTVISKGSPVFGEFKDHTVKRIDLESESKTFIINHEIIFGSIKIMN